MNMLKVLFEMEQKLPEWLKKPDEWQSLNIDYHPPRVKRVWRQEDDFRICLHLIFPCKKREALLHPHPWPSAMRIISGNYLMLSGFSATDKQPPISMEQILVPGSAYTMIDPDLWHAVVPIKYTSLSLMVIGQPWKEQRHKVGAKSDKELQPLEDPIKNWIIWYTQTQLSLMSQ